MCVSEATLGGESRQFKKRVQWAGVYRCVLAMDFEFILKVAERRLKAALGKAEAGRIFFTLTAAVCYLLHLSLVLLLYIFLKFFRSLLKNVKQFLAAYNDSFEFQLYAWLK